ncbi:MAG: hypothetical protein ACKVXR_00370 [Planctomycetota bacterium]
MHRTALTTLLLAILAGILLLLARARPFMPSPIAPGETATNEPVEEFAAPAAVSPAVTVAPSAREAGTEASAPAATASLLIRVTDRRGGAAVEGASLALEAADSSPEEQPAGILGNPAFDADALTDARGESRLGVPSGISMRLLVTGTGPDVGNRSVSVPALAPGEQRELSIDLPSGLDLEFWVRVVSAENGEPVAGARILLLAGGPSISSPPGVPPKRLFSEVGTDAAGLARIRVPSWRSVLASVEAAGFGPVVTAVVQGHPDPEHAQVLRLSRSASLSIVVLSAQGSPLPGLRVALSTSTASIARPEGTGLTGNDPEWSASTDPDGRCAIEGLPPEAELRAQIRRGEDLLLRIAEPIVLAPGERAERTFAFGAGARLSGLLLGPSSEPVPDVVIWLVRAPPGPASGPTDRYFQRATPEEVFATARTDSGGSFRFDGLEAGDWWIGPGALSSEEEVASQLEIATRATGVRIKPDETEIQLVIRAHTGLHLRGRVVGPNGEGIALVFVSGSPEGGADVLTTRSSEDGSFTLGPLAPGLFSLRAQGRWGMADSDPVQASSNEQEVLLRLAPGGTLRGRVYDEATGRPCAATVLLLSDPNLPPRRASAGREAAFEFRGLRAGTYDLSARSEDGRIGILRGVFVRSGVDNESAAIAMAPGAKLRVRCLGESAGGRVTVLAEGILVALESLRPGTSALLPVPVGRLLVRFTTPDGGGEEREVQTAAGDGETEIVFSGS